MTAAASPGGDTALAVAMVAALALLVAGTRLVARRADAGDRQRGLLMIAAAVVLVANVLIWAL